MCAGEVITFAASMPNRQLTSSPACGPTLGNLLASRGTGPSTLPRRTCLRPTPCQLHASDACVSWQKSAGSGVIRAASHDIQNGPVHKLEDAARALLPLVQSQPQAICTHRSQTPNITSWRGTRRRCRARTWLHCSTAHSASCRTRPGPAEHHIYIGTWLACVT